MHHSLKRIFETVHEFGIKHSSYRWESDVAPFGRQGLRAGVTLWDKDSKIKPAGTMGEYMISIFERQMSTYKQEIPARFIQQDSWEITK